MVVQEHPRTISCKSTGSDLTTEDMVQEQSLEHKPVIVSEHLNIA